MLKIKTKDLSQFSNEYITSVGKIKFDNFGYCELEDEKAKQLVSEDVRLELFDETKNTEENKLEDNSNSYRKDLMKMKAVQLQDLVKETGLPESEWIDLNKAQLVDYLVNKASESNPV